MCDESATVLKFNKQAVDNGDEDLDGAGIGWCETRELIENLDSGEDEENYTIYGYCSSTCIHFAGELAHAGARD
jgi:hypothetical protein